MTVMQQFSADLTRAACQRADREITLRRRVRRTGLAAAGVLTLGTAVATATSIWQPQLGDGRRGHPTADFSSPPADELAALGILRRASTAVDRSAESTYALRLLDPSLHGVRTAYVRQLGSQPNGGGFILIPVQSYQAPDASGSTIANALCIFARDRDGGGLGCYSMQQILEGHAVGSLVQPGPAETAATASPQPSGSHFTRERVSLTQGFTYGLVPDGVASVTITNQQGTVTVPTHENFFQASLPAAHGPDARRLRTSTPTAIQWKNPAGQIIATPNPTP
jgi:hypothetical protein